MTSESRSVQLRAGWIGGADRVGGHPAEGMPPAAVADLVVAAIRDDRYWIPPHPEWVEIAMERFHRIGDGQNPVQPEHFPGMPPRSEMVAEVLAAMGLQPPEG